LVGVFSLASGVLLDYVKGNQHQHELALLCANSWIGSNPRTWPSATEAFVAMS
jgi:hypothetical protein